MLESIQRGYLAWLVFVLSALYGSAVEVTSIRAPIMPFDFINNFVTAKHHAIQCSTEPCVVNGSDNDDDLFLVDLRSHARHGVPVAVNGRGQRTSDGDALAIIGDGSELTYIPDAHVFGSGVIRSGNSSFSFSGLEQIYVQNLDTLNFKTSTGANGSGADRVTVDVPFEGFNRIRGSSGGVPFEPIVFNKIKHVNIELDSNMAKQSADSLRFQCPQSTDVFPAAEGLKSINVAMGGSLSFECQQPAVNMSVDFNSKFKDNRVAVPGGKNNLKLAGFDESVVPVSDNGVPLAEPALRLLNEFFSAVKSAGDSINDIMTEKLPLIDRSFEEFLHISPEQTARWGELLDFNATIQRYARVGNVSPTTLVADMLTDFDTRLAHMPIAKDLFVSAGVNTGLFTLNMSIDATLQRLFSPNFTESLSAFHIPVTFDLTATLPITAKFKFGVSVSFDMQNPGNAPIIHLDALRLDVSAHEQVEKLDFSVGIIAGSSSGGLFSFNATAEVLPIATTTMAELASPAFYQTSGPLYVHLPLQAEVMGVTLTQPDTAVVIQSKNMFASGPHANFTGGAALTSFKDFGPRQLVMVLKQLATLLDNYRDVGPLGFELPFTHNKTIGGVLKFGDMFADRLISALTVQHQSAEKLMLRGDDWPLNEYSSSDPSWNRLQLHTDGQFSLQIDGDSRVFNYKAPSTISADSVRSALQQAISDWSSLVSVDVTSPARVEFRVISPHPVANFTFGIVSDGLPSSDSSSAGPKYLFSVPDGTAARTPVDPTFTTIDNLVPILVDLGLPRDLIQPRIVFSPSGLPSAIELTFLLNDKMPTTSAHLDLGFNLEPFASSTVDGNVHVSGTLALQFTLGVELNVPTAISVSLTPAADKLLECSNVKSWSFNLIIDNQTTQIKVEQSAPLANATISQLATSVKAALAKQLPGQFNVTTAGKSLVLTTVAGSSITKLAISNDTVSAVGCDVSAALGLATAKSPPKPASYAAYARDVSFTGEITVGAEVNKAHAKFASVVDIEIRSGDGNFTLGFDAKLHAPADPANSKLSMQAFRRALVEDPFSICDVAITPQANLHLSDIAVGIPFFDQHKPSVVISLPPSPIPVSLHPANLTSRFHGQWVVHSPLGSLNDLRHLNFTNLLDAVVHVLDIVNNPDVPFALAHVPAMNQKLPMVGASVSQLVNVADKLAHAVQSVNENPASGLLAVQRQLNSLIGGDTCNSISQHSYGCPSVTLNFTGDSNGTALTTVYFEFTYYIARQASSSFSFDLGTLAHKYPALADLHLLDIASQAAIGVDASAALSLRLVARIGSSIANTTFWLEPTAAPTLSARVNATARDVSFDASVGPFSLDLQHGEVDVDFALNVNLTQPVQLLRDRHNGTAFAIDAHGEANCNFQVQPHIKGVLVETPSMDLGLRTKDFAGLINGRGMAFEMTPENFGAAVDGWLSMFKMDKGKFVKLVLSNPGLLLDGFDKILAEMEEAMKGAEGAFGHKAKLPIIGNGISKVLGAESQFIDSFRHKILARFKAEITEMTADSDLPTVLRNALFHVLHDQLGILQSTTGADSGSLSHDDIALKYVDIKGNVTTQESADGMEISFKVGQKLERSKGIAFDVGLDGLPLALSTTGGVDLDLYWELRVTFGLSCSKGFYVRPHRDNNGELVLRAKAALPQASLSGELFVLKATATDHGSNLDLQCSVNFNTDSDRVTLATFKNTRVSSLLKSGCAGDASVRLLLTLETDHLPKFETEFYADWDFGRQTHAASLGPVDVDMREFYESTIKPIGDHVEKFMGPVNARIAPLRARIPGLSDLAKTDVSLLTLPDFIAMFAGHSVSKLDQVQEFTHAVDFLTQFSSLTKELFKTGKIRLSDGFNFTGNLAKSPKPYRGAPAVHSVQRPATESAQRSTGKGVVGKIQAELAKYGIAIPLLSNTTMIENLLTGKVADIITIQTPRLEVDNSFDFTVEIWGPVAAWFSGRIAIAAQLAIGFDSFGLQAAIRAKNPVLALNGFYLKTSMDGGKTPYDVVSLQGSISVGLGLDLVVVRAGIEGGAHFYAGVSLADPNRNGKLRVSDMVQLFNAGDHGSGFLNLFNAHINTGVSISVVVELFAVVKWQRVWSYGICGVTIGNYEHVAPTFLPLVTVDKSGTATLNHGPLVSEATDFCESKVRYPLVNGDASGAVYHIANLGSGFSVIQAHSGSQCPTSSSTVTAVGKFAIEVKPGDSVILTSVNSPVQIAPVSVAPHALCVLDFTHQKDVQYELSLDGLRACSWVDIYTGSGSNVIDLKALPGKLTIYSGNGSDTVRFRPSQLLDRSGDHQVDLVAQAGSTGSSTLVIDCDDAVHVEHGQISADGVQGFDLPDIHFVHPVDSIKVIMSNSATASMDIRSLTPNTSVAVTMTNPGNVVNISPTVSGSGNQITVNGAKSPLGLEPGGVLIVDGSAIAGGQFKLETGQLTGLGDYGVNFNYIANLALYLSQANDFITVSGSTVGNTDIYLQGGDDRAVIEQTTGPLRMYGGKGADRVEILHATGDVFVDGQEGDDVFSQQQVLGVVFIDGGAGNNRVEQFPSGRGRGNVTVQNCDLFINMPLARNVSLLDGVVLYGDEKLTYSNVANLTIIANEPSFDFAVRLGVDKPAHVNASTSISVKLHGPDNTFVVSGMCPSVSLSVTDEGFGGNRVFLEPEGSTSLSAINGAFSFRLAGDLPLSRANALFIKNFYDDRALVSDVNSTTISGFGLGASANVSFSRFDLIQIKLGSGASRTTIASMGGQRSDVNTTVDVQCKSHANTVIVGAGTLAPLVDVRVHGQANDIIVDHSTAAKAFAGNLTATNLTWTSHPMRLFYDNADSLTVWLSSLADALDVQSTHSGRSEIHMGEGSDNATIWSIFGATKVFGDGDSDFFAAPPPLSKQNPIHAPLILDVGTGNHDLFELTLYGVGTSRIVASHSGEGVPQLNVRLAQRGDVLFRKDPNVLASTDENNQTELIEYYDVDKVNVYGSAEDDRFTFDDTGNNIEVRGEGGDDKFIVGQVFNAPRAGVETIETTRGFVSNGCSRQLLLNGGPGDDLFLMIHNKGEVSGFGDDGDDVMVVRTFAERRNINFTGGEGNDTFAFSEISDTKYAESAELNVDGGPGHNTLGLIGTDQADVVVVTPTEICGAGRSTIFHNFQQFAVSGAEGNDIVYVLGTPFGAAVRISGGQGSDKVIVAPGKVEPANCPRDSGHSAIVDHGVRSDITNSIWNNILADGIVANVRSANSTDRAGHVGFGVFIPHPFYLAFGQFDGVRDFGDAPFVPSFTVPVRLTAPPAPHEHVTINIQDPFSAGDARRTYIGGVLAYQGVTFDRQSVTFDSSNWDVIQNITISMKANPSCEDATQRVSLMVSSPTHPKLKLPILQVMLENTARFRAIVRPNPALGADKGLHLLEGRPVTGSDAFDQYSQLYITLFPPEGGTSCVNLTLPMGIKAVVGRYPNPQFSDYDHHNGVCTSSEMGPVVSFVATLSVPDDHIPNGVRFTRIGVQHTICLDGLDCASVNLPSVDVRIEDTNTPGLIVIERAGSVDAIEPHLPHSRCGDPGVQCGEYIVLLTQSPAVRETITVHPKPQLTKSDDHSMGCFAAILDNASPLTSISLSKQTGECVFGQLRQISFNSEDWYQAKSVQVRGFKDDSVPLPTDSWVSYPTKLRSTAQITAPVHIFGGLDVSEYDYIPVAKLLPGEPADASSYNGASTTVYAEERMQNNTLIINDRGNKFPGRLSFHNNIISGLQMAGVDSPGLIVDGMQWVQVDLGDVERSIFIDGFSAAIDLNVGKSPSNITIDNLVHDCVVEAPPTVVTRVNTKAGALSALLVLRGGASPGESGGTVVTLDDSMSQAANLDVLVSNNTVFSSLMGPRMNLSLVILLELLATDGTFSLSFPSARGGPVTTTPIPYNADHSVIERALQDAIFPHPTCGRAGISSCASSFRVITLNTTHVLVPQGELRYDLSRLGELTVDTTFLTGVQFSRVRTSGAGLVYNDVRELNVLTGSSDDLVRVTSTSAQTTQISTGAGNDTVLGSSAADAAGSFDVAWNTNELAGTLQHMQGKLVLDLGMTGANKLLLSDLSSSRGANVDISETEIAVCWPNLPQQQDCWSEPDNRNALITYKAVDIERGLTVCLGSHDDAVTVGSVLSSAAHRNESARSTWTMINTGDGNDRVDAKITHDGGNLCVNLQDGNDSYNGKDSTWPVIVFGGHGADDITCSQSAADVVFGDMGRIETSSGLRLGGGGLGDVVAAVDLDKKSLTSAVFAYTIPDDTVAPNSSANNDVIRTGTGSQWIFGGEGSDTIKNEVINPSANPSVDVVFADFGALSLVNDTFHATDSSADVSRLSLGTTTFPTIGSQTNEPYNDTVDVSGTSHVLVFGSQGTDTITVKSPVSISFTDMGEVIADRRLSQFSARTTLHDVAGDDTLTIQPGSDFAVQFGGPGSDYIHDYSRKSFVFGDCGTAVVSLENWNINTTAVQCDKGGRDTIVSASQQSALDGFGFHFITAGPYSDTVQPTSTTAKDHFIICGDNCALQGQLESRGGSFTVTTDATEFDGEDEVTVPRSTLGVVLGGGGSDTLVVKASSSVVLGDNGVVRFNSTPSSGRWSSLEAVTSHLSPPSHNLDDKITVTQEQHGECVVFGGEGNDAIVTTNSDDIVCGDLCEATFVSSNWIAASWSSTFPNVGGADDIQSGGGNDRVIGGAGADLINGGDGNDMLFGDAASFDTESQILVALPSTGGASDTIDGGSGDDLICGQEGSDTLNGGEGNDDIIGGSNVAFANDAKDTIHGGTGDDVIAGDNARITRSVKSQPPVGFGGLPAIEFSKGVPVPRRVQLLDYESLFQSDVTAFGDDELFGDDGDDVVFGQSGNDSLNGGNGNDDLVGGLGHDHLDGGEGNDSLVGDCGHVYKTSRLADGNFGRSIELEEPAVLSRALSSGYQPETVHLSSAQELASNSMFLVGGIVNGNNTKVITDNQWHSYTIALDLLQPGTDKLIGGNGDDTLIGGRGGDTLSGDGGRDFVIGDNAFVRMPSSNLPTIALGYRILEDTNSRHGELPLVVPAEGVLVFPPATILPRQLDTFLSSTQASFVGGAAAFPVNELARDVSPESRIPVRDSDVLFHPVVAFMNSWVTAGKDQLSGNDEISCTEGDICVGDNMWALSQPESGELSALREAREQAGQIISSAQRRLSSLSFLDDQHDSANRNNCGRSSVQLGCDKIGGPGWKVGDDLIVTQANSSPIVSEVLARFHLLRDIELVSAGFDRLLASAQFNFNRFELSATLESSCHFGDVEVGVDKIYSTSPDDVVVGDHLIVGLASLSEDDRELGLDRALRGAQLVRDQLRLLETTFASPVNHTVNAELLIQCAMSKQFTWSKNVMLVDGPHAFSATGSAAFAIATNALNETEARECFAPLQDAIAHAFEQSRAPSKPAYWQSYDRPYFDSAQCEQIPSFIAALKSAQSSANIPNNVLSSWASLVSQFVHTAPELFFDQPKTAPQLPFNPFQDVPELELRPATPTDAQLIRILPPFFSQQSTNADSSTTAVCQPTNEFTFCVDWTSSGWTFAGLNSAAQGPLSFSAGSPYVFVLTPKALTAGFTVFDPVDGQSLSEQSGVEVLYVPNITGPSKVAFGTKNGSQVIVPVVFTCTPTENHLCVLYNATVLPAVVSFQTVPGGPFVPSTEMKWRPSTFGYTFQLIFDAFATVPLYVSQSVARDEMVAPVVALTPDSSVDNVNPTYGGTIAYTFPKDPASCIILHSNTPNVAPTSLLTSEGVNPACVHHQWVDGQLQASCMCASSTIVPLWAQLILVFVGVLFLVLAFCLWQGLRKRWRSKDNGPSSSAEPPTSVPQPAAEV